MGQIKQVLFVQPPLLIREHPVVREESHGHKCPICVGNGEVPTKGDDRENRYETCPYCKGSKKVKAVITTEWMPDNNKD